MVNKITSPITPLEEVAKINEVIDAIPTESTVSGWGFTKNAGTVTSVNNVSPVNGNVSLTIPTVNNATLTITQGGTTKGTFTANASSNVTIDLDAGGGSVDVDNKSITTNSSDQIQTVGVINSRDSSTAIKTWTGTKAQYDAIVTKDANTLYNVTDSIYEEELQLSNPFSLLDYKFSEYEISNASWLRSNGQYNSGTTYADVYNLLLQIKNGTVTKAGVSVKLSTDTYADTDFVLNTSDTTFRLPLKVALASGKAVAGNGVALGLTDGTNSLGLYTTTSGLASSSQNFGLNVGTGTAGNTYANKKVSGVTTDPTKSGIETSANGLYLYFYVGAVIQDASVIAAASVLTQIANLSFDYVVESQLPTAENNYTWYRKYKSGWVEQGGMCSNSGSDEGSVTLPVQMADATYTLVATNESNTAINAWGWVYVKNNTKTTTGFSLLSRQGTGNTAPLQASWQVSGQGAN